MGHVTELVCVFLKQVLTLPYPGRYFQTWDLK